MKSRPALPKGTRDFNSIQLYKRNYIIDIIENDSLRYESMLDVKAHFGTRMKGFFIPIVKKTVPTGFFLVPPSGPAIPVIERTILVLVFLYKYFAICKDVFLLTDP